MMKRERCCSCMGGAPPKRAATMLCLNIGGKHLDTTKETLREASYFHPYIEGDFTPPLVNDFVRWFGYSECVGLVG